MLQKAQSDLKKQLHREEEFWKQKAGMEWFTDTEKYKILPHHNEGEKKQIMS